MIIEDLILLDTNTLINFLKGEEMEISLVGSNRIAISEITEMEIQCQPNFTKTQRKELKSFLSNLTIIPLNSLIKDLAIKIRLSTSMKLMDSIMAATSQYMDLPLITCDEKFSSIRTAKIILLPTVAKRQ